MALPGDVPYQFHVGYFPIWSRRMSDIKPVTAPDIGYQTDIALRASMTSDIWHDIYFPILSDAITSHGALILRSRTSIESRFQSCFLPWGSSHLRWPVEASTTTAGTVGSFWTQVIMIILLCTANLTCRFPLNQIFAAVTTDGSLHDEPMSSPETFFLFLMHADALDDFALSQVCIDVDVKTQ